MAISLLFFFVGLCYFCLWQIFSLYFLSFPPSKPVLHRALAVLLAQPFFFLKPLLDFLRSVDDVSW